MRQTPGRCDCCRGTGRARTADSRESRREQRIAFLQHHVTRLVTNGALNDGQGNALAVKLQGALEKLADGETAPAMNKLGAFINQIDAFRDGGILSDGRSASLLEIARDVVNRASDRLALAGGVP